MRRKLVYVLTILVVCLIVVALIYQNVPAIKKQWLKRQGAYAAAEKEEWEKVILSMMEKRISFDFVDWPIQDVVAFLNNLSGVNIVVGPESASMGIPITLKVNDMRLGAAMEWILSLCGLTYTLRNEAIYISTPERLAEKNTKAYDLAGKVPEAQRKEFQAFLMDELEDEDLDARACVKIFGDILVLHRLGDDAQKLISILNAMGIPRTGE